MYEHEYWINVKGSERYEVSNLGNIRNKFTGKILSPQLNRSHNGYVRVSLDYGRDYVHRVVARSFFDTDITDKDVNHLDSNRLNNQLSNLEICTRKENIQHAVLNGLRNSTIVSVVRCKKCIHHQYCEIAVGKSVDFYCADGECK